MSPDTVILLFLLAFCLAVFAFVVWSVHQDRKLKRHLIETLPELMTRDELAERRKRKERR